MIALACLWVVAVWQYQHSGAAVIIVAVQMDMWQMLQ